MLLFGLCIVVDLHEICILKIDCISFNFTVIVLYNVVVLGIVVLIVLNCDTFYIPGLNGFGSVGFIPAKA
jgi:hypothetical protein